MYLNDFSARVVEGRETSGGYVEMRHGQTYTLRLRNSRSVKCDARVEIDGKHVGTWRINAHGGITLERPEHDSGRFTFYKLGTAEADAAQLNGSSPDLGLVKVTFTPERECEIQYWYTTPHPYPYDPSPWYPKPRPIRHSPWQPRPWRPAPKRYDWKCSTTDGSRSVMDCHVYYTACASATPKNLSAGGTGLSGESGQRFGVANNISYDYSQQTTIHLRLVCKDDEPRGPRPLTSTSNPIPSRIW